MKTLIYSLFGLCLSLSSIGKEVSKEKHAHASVSAIDIERLNIDAKNTELIIDIWAKEEVSVDAHFYYRGDEDHKEIKAFMDSFEENVKSGISSFGGEIKLDTYRAVPSKKKVGWESSWASVTFVNEGFSDKEAKLVYELKVPASLYMNIKHSYKELRINGSVRKINIEQYSGRLSLDKVDQAILNLKYGEASINDLKKGELHLYENSVMGNDWGNIQLNAKYSKVQVRTVNTLKGEGYETKYRTIDLGSIVGNYKYCQFDMIEVELLKLTCYETQVESKSVQQLDLNNSKYSNYHIDDVDNLSITESYEDEYSFRSVKNVAAPNSKYCKFNIETLQGNYGLNAYECRVNINAISGSSGSIKIDGKYLNISLGLADLHYKLAANLQYGKLYYPNSLTGNFKQQNSRTTASLQSANLAKDFYLVEINGYEINASVK